MRIKYEFCTEDVEIEVSEQWASVLQELDREEYNSNHRETRRHQQMDETKCPRSCLCAVGDVEEDVIAAMEIETLYNAIEQLKPRHRYLIYQVYFQQRSFADIAREIGVNKASVMRTTACALKNLKTICEQMQL